jgi:hypothetical protein
MTLVKQIYTDIEASISVNQPHHCYQRAILFKF